MDFSALNPRCSNSLNIAARNNDVKNLLRLLESGRNQNCTDNRGWTALHEAAAKNSIDTLRILLKHPSTLLRVQTFEGQTALFLACHHNCSIESIQLILDNVKSIVNRTSNENVSPLHVVCSQGRVKAVELLIKAGANVDLQDFDGDTPLHEAAREKHSEVASLLLHAGAEPNLRNSYGLTPFLLACFKGTLNCVLEILPFIGDINDCAYDGNTGIILATQRGALDVVRFLLGNDANPDLPNYEGALPLYIALVQGHAKLFQLLLPVTDINVINRNMMNSACKPLYFSMDIIITMLESDLGPEFFNECDTFHVILEKIFGFKPRYSVNPPLCSILNVIEYIFKSSVDLCRSLLLLLLTKGVAVNPLYEDECPPLVYLHYCDHINCHPLVIDILIEQGCNVDYSTMCKADSIQIPDAIIASVTSNGHTLPILLSYSLKIDPEQLIDKLIEFKMIGERISVEILKRILPTCSLNVKSSLALEEQLSPYLENMNLDQVGELLQMLKPHVPSLKHTCRRIIRRRLRLKAFTTQDFLNALQKLPLPTTLKFYLRFT